MEYAKKQTKKTWLQYRHIVDVLKNALSVWCGLVLFFPALATVATLFTVFRVFVFKIWCLGQRLC